jgi:hypothetical protein
LPTPLGPTDLQSQDLINHAISEDSKASFGLLYHACEQFWKLTHKTFRAFSRPQSSEQTDVVLRNAMIRLHRALSEAKVESVRQFFNLAAKQGRRELLDLENHYSGPNGIGKTRHTDSWSSGVTDGCLTVAISAPKNFERWLEFHYQVEKLPPEHQEIANLVVYQGLKQETAAKLMGLRLRAFRRRWQLVKMRISQEMQDGAK